MSDEEKNSEQKEGMQMYYVIGAIVALVLIVGGFLIKSKPKKETAQPPAETTATIPAPLPNGPINGLTCDKHYYNPVIGFPRYYLSVEGADVSSASRVTCNFVIRVEDEVVASTSATAGLSAVAERNGGIYTCRTEALDLEPNVPTKVDVEIRDDKNVVTYCGATYILP